MEYILRRMDGGASHMSFRAILLSLTLEPEERGFHTLNFRVVEDHGDPVNVDVMISRDAQRKLQAQARKLGAKPVAEHTLIVEWGIWALNERLDRGAPVPTRVAVVAGDLDEYGAYAQNVLRVAGLAA